MTTGLRNLVLGLFAAALFAGESTAGPAGSDYPVTSVPQTAVKFTGGFWGTRQKTDLAVTIRHTMKECEDTNRIKNFELAAAALKGAKDGKFATAYAFLSGYGMSGDAFFYPNPLASHGQHERTPWFTCACCPPNVARFIAELSGFAYGVEAVHDLYEPSDSNDHDRGYLHWRPGPRACPGVLFRRTRPWLKATGEWRAEGSSLDPSPSGALTLRADGDSSRATHSAAAPQSFEM